MSKSKVFCAYPYVSLFVANSGKQLPCCYAQNAHTPDMPMPNISDARTIQDLWNSPYIRNVRETMNSAKFPSACGICRRTEALGGVSHRQRSLEQFDEAVQDVTIDQGHMVTSSIRHLDLRLGNKCNLACRMCHPASSNQLIPEWSASEDPQERREAELVRARKQWSHSDRCIDILKSPEVDPLHIHIAGGEPAIDRKHERILEYLVETGKSRQMTLSYNTNLTQVVPGLRWREDFKNIVILASVDGAGAVNEYIRYPSQWVEIDKMLRFYVDQCNQYGNVQMEVNVTVSAYNILDLSNLFKYLASLPSSRPIVPVFTLVHDPAWLQISVLPKDLLLKAKENMLSVSPLYGCASANSLMEERTSVILAWVDEAITEQKNFEIFRKKTEFFDLQRSASVLDIIPQLQQYWRQTPVLQEPIV